MQKKISLTPLLCEFVDNYEDYGYKDRSSMVQAALYRLKEVLERESLNNSADLYAEIYAGDTALRELTELAIEDWPE